MKLFVAYCGVAPIAYSKPARSIISAFYRTKRSGFPQPMPVFLSITLWNASQTDRSITLERGYMPAMAPLRCRGTRLQAMQVSWRVSN